MLKCIYCFILFEVIVEVLEFYVCFIIVNVCIIKNRIGFMGYIYGFIDFDFYVEVFCVVKILQNFDLLFSIDGKMVVVNLVIGK